MNRGEYLHLLSEKKAVERLLAKTPEKSVLVRTSLRARLSKIEKAIARATPDEREPARVTVTFMGHTRSYPQPLCHIEYGWWSNQESNLDLPTKAPCGGGNRTLGAPSGVVARCPRHTVVMFNDRRNPSAISTSPVRRVTTYPHQMADPTLADVMAAIANLALNVHRVDLQNQQQTALLAALTTGVQIMSQTADQTASAVAALDAKVDTLIGLVQPSIQTLRDQLAAAQTQIAALQAGDAADAATLAATISAAQAEADKVDAAIAALTPQVAG